MGGGANEVDKKHRKVTAARQVKLNAKMAFSRDRNECIILGLAEDGRGGWEEGIEEVRFCDTGGKRCAFSLCLQAPCAAGSVRRED